MARHNINIQDGYLFQQLKDGRAVVVDLITGNTVSGRLRRFDRFAVVVDTGRREILVYKHAIATISESDGEADHPRARSKAARRPLTAGPVGDGDRQPTAWTAR